MLSNSLVVKKKVHDYWYPVIILGMELSTVDCQPYPHYHLPRRAIPRWKVVTILVVEMVLVRQWYLQSISSLWPQSQSISDAYHHHQHQWPTWRNWYLLWLFVPPGRCFIFNPISYHCQHQYHQWSMHLSLHPTRSIPIPPWLLLFKWSPSQSHPLPPHLHYHHPMLSPTVRLVCHHHWGLLVLRVSIIERLLVVRMLMMVGWKKTVIHSWMNGVRTIPMMMVMGLLLILVMMFLFIKRTRRCLQALLRSSRHSTLSLLLVAILRPRLSPMGIG